MTREYDIDFEFAIRSGEVAGRIADVANGGGSRVGLQAIVDEVDKLIADSKPDASREQWKRWFKAARCVLAADALAEAMRTSAGIADAKARKEIAQSDFVEACELDAVVPESERELAARVAEEFSTPLPTLYWRRDRRWDRFHKIWNTEEAAAENAPDESLPTIARLIVNIDDVPLVSPQAVRPTTLYRLGLEAHLGTWPAKIAGLGFRFTTTLGASQYSLSEFPLAQVVEKKGENQVARASGTLAFPYAQNDPFSPIIFAVSAFLRVGEEEHPVRVIGHDQLAFRIRDESRTLLSSGWSRMDVHVHDLLLGLCTQQPAVRSETDTLIPLLNGLTAVLGTFAQGGVLKGTTRIREADFQSEVLKLLRMQSALGEDVQEGPKLAGGITDIRFRGAIVELKVEDVTSDRERLFAKYTRQATQYQGSEARSVAILLVLDLTEKDEPPGDLRNDIMLGEVSTHGGSGDYPSWAFMFIVRGNVKSPSFYSS